MASSATPTRVALTMSAAPATASAGVSAGSATPGNRAHNAPRAVRRAIPYARRASLPGGDRGQHRRRGAPGAEHRDHGARGRPAAETHDGVVKALHVGVVTGERTVLGPERVDGAGLARDRCHARTRRGDGGFVRRRHVAGGAVARQHTEQRTEITGRDVARFVNQRNPRGTKRRVLKSRRQRVRDRMTQQEKPGGTRGQLAARSVASRSTAR